MSENVNTRLDALGPAHVLARILSAARRAVSRLVARVREIDPRPFDLRERYSDANTRVSSEIKSVFRRIKTSNKFCFIILFFA